LAKSLFAELKRRNVFKVGVAYLVLAWVVIQVTQAAVPALRLPDWVNSFVFFIGALGFPFALFFAWAFEITPEGVKRESEINPEDSIVRDTSRKLEFVVIGLLIIGMGYFIYESRFSSPSEQIVVEKKSKTDKSKNEQAGDANHRHKISLSDNFKETIKLDTASIAVLPFVNMSSDPEQEYFSDGISEELLNLLAQIDGLKVAARTSSFFFKGKNIPIQEIAKTLNVKHILEGSVRKSGTQVRITAQLIRAEDGFHLWSKSYDRKLDNIFAIQDEISAAIVQELRGRLMDENPPLKQTGTTNTQAYQEYLKGRYFWNLRGVKNLYRAKKYFERATDLDANYVDAWLGLGETLGLLPIWEFDSDKAPEHHLQARLAVARALAIYPKSGRGYAILGNLNIQRIEWRQSMKNFRLALKYEPQLASSWQWYAGLLSNIGKIEESTKAFDIALRLDPLSTVIGANAAETFLLAGQYEKAIERIHKTLAIAPNYPYGLFIQGFFYLNRNDFDAARTSFSNYADEIEISKAPFLDLVNGIEKFILNGTPVPLNEIIYDPVSFDQYYTNFALVLGGHYDKALDVIERQSKTNIPITSAFFLRSYLYQKKMGHMPRYQELVQRLATMKEKEE